ncbi:MAG: preprotein translocase subunit SecY [Oscillospiraceae bacterium]|jgi:preprotein translocase subunit SecY|nr:preprotein translocase subunit SecY [Oscillospiraceae bacterium]
MLEILKNAWRNVELRKKILYTLLIIIVFRLGSHIPVPFINTEALRTLFSQQSGGVDDIFNYLSILTGGAMQYGALFAMSVTPYINSSIIMQLLTVAIPPLGRLQKEGEVGQKKIAAITRYVTVALGLVQGGAYYFYLRNSAADDGATPLMNEIYKHGFTGFFCAAVIILCFSAGTALMMWLGEQIDKKGVGNGISILLFAGIISRLPDGIRYIIGLVRQGSSQYATVIGIILLVAFVIVFVVWMTGAERRIPIQYAKRVVGRKVYGGQNTHIPIKVNMSGVMPIIFASSILALPSTVMGFMGNPQNFKSNITAKIYSLLGMMSIRSWLYAVIYVLMIVGFAFFYVSIQYNPVEIANNLRKNSGAVPGIRPGKPTQDFIKRILTKVTLIGALFLGIIAILPVLLSIFGQVNLMIGGTSVLIVVGVALDTVRQLESQLMMRHYKGFLD